MGRFLDRIVLKASRHPLPAENASRRWIEWSDSARGELAEQQQRIECFTWCVGPSRGANEGQSNDEQHAGAPDLLVIKYCGAAGRAENASLHPFDYWSDLSGCVSVANSPGFGNSAGRPRLDRVVPWALETFDTIARENPHVPILVSGSSLGATVAICVAAKRAVQGILVRDPPQIAEVIWNRFGWKTLWLPAWLTMKTVPQSLNAVTAARNCYVPAVIVSSSKDRVVPSPAQRVVIDAYQGPKRIIKLADAGHYDPMAPGEIESYHSALDWLRAQLFNSP